MTLDLVKNLYDSINVTAKLVKTLHILIFLFNLIMISNRREADDGYGKAI